MVYKPQDTQYNINCGSIGFLQGERKLRMAYCLGNGIWESVFAVPSAVTDQYLKIASGLSVKVLLLILRNQGNLALNEIAEILGQSASDIQDAIYYWIECGVILPTDTGKNGISEIHMEGAQTGKAVGSQFVPAEEKASGTDTGIGTDSPHRIEIVTRGRRRLSADEIHTMSVSDENIAHLLQETQSIIGSTLTPIATETILSLYTYHGMKPDLILMLMQYCKSIEKETSMRYIEKMAADWMDRGIDAHEKAEEEILRLSQIHSVEGKIKAALGIYNRSLITSEKKYIAKWTTEYKQDIQLISFAYERTVEVKGAPNFAYTNGILSNWHQRGITTVAQAKKDIREYTASTPPPKKSNASYDMNELESMITCGDI